MLRRIPSRPSLLRTVNSVPRSASARNHSPGVTVNAEAPVAGSTASRGSGTANQNAWWAAGWAAPWAPPCASEPDACGSAVAPDPPVASASSMRVKPFSE